MFARATTGVTADLFAVVEAMPVTDFGIQRDEGDLAQAFGKRLILDPFFELGIQQGELILQRQDELAQRSEHSQQPGIGVA